MNILKTTAYDSIIKYLRKVMGYSFNKFMNIDTTNNAFNERMASYISDSGKVDISKLEEFNSYLANIKDAHGLSSKEIDKFDKIIENIAIHYIEEKALNLEYYNKRTLDVNKIGNDIEEIFILANDARLSEIDEQPAFMRKIYTKCLKKVLINSHLRLTENVENLSKELYDPKIIASNEKNKYEILDKKEKSSTRLKVKKFNEILKKNEKNVPEKLIKLRLIPNKKFIECGNLNVLEFISQVSIIANATKMKQQDVEKAISEYMLKNNSNKTNTDLVHKLTLSNWHNIYSIDSFSKDAIRDNLYNAFYKISEKKYIYHSDGGFYFFEITN